jgi:hypothetical protein
MNIVPAAVKPRDWAAIWDAAAAAAADTASSPGVYPGPAWESGSPETRVWKIAVLRRRLSGGAEHWGHLFVVAGPDSSTVIIRPEGGMLADRDQPPLETIPRMPGDPFEVRLRPRSADSAASLREFAIAFRGRALEILSDP